MTFAIKIYDCKYLKKVGLTDSIYDSDLLEFKSFSEAIKYIESNFDESVRKSSKISIIRIIDR